MLIIFPQRQVPSPGIEYCGIHAWGAKAIEAATRATKSKSNDSDEPTDVESALEVNAIAVAADSLYAGGGDNVSIMGDADVEVLTWKEVAKANDSTLQSSGYFP